MIWLNILGFLSLSTLLYFVFNRFEASQPVSYLTMPAGHKRRNFLEKTLAMGVVFCLPFIANQFDSGEFLIGTCILIGIYIVLGMGINVVVGYAGMLDLGFVAFYGIGAYTSALITLAFGGEFWWIAIFAGGIMGSALGVIVGAPTLRLTGDYLAIVTLAFGEILRICFNNLEGVTGGTRGLPGVPSPVIPGLDFEFFEPIHFYYLICLLVLLVKFGVDRLVDSRVGRAWEAMREDETAAQLMGINLMWFKTLGYATGAFIAGVAGAFFANYFSIVHPTSFTFVESVIILAIVVLGGMGSMWGAIFGAIILTAIPELLRGADQYRMLIFGAMMVGVMIIKPRGFVIKFRNRLKPKSVQGVV